MNRLCMPLLFASLLPAQRPDATFEWQKRTTSITYGAVPVGQHNLGDLKVGENWRLGFNDASTWQVAMPILCGDAWIAPGQYRVTLTRRAETKGALAANGSLSAIGSNAEAQVEGDITKAGKPTKKLSIDWAKAGAAEHGNQPATITAQFGETQWRGDVLVLGNKVINVPGGKLAVFSVPSERLAAGPVPIATLTRSKGGEQSWNVVLDKSKARLVPWMAAPKDSFGFGQVVPPDAALVSEGTVTALPATADKPLDVLELREATLAKGDLRLVVAYGNEAVEIHLPEPKGKPGK